MAITDLDDLPIHQIPYTMDHVDGRDPRWVDELWFHIGAPDGVSLAVHMGVYPGTNSMDAAASIMAPGAQTDLRFARVLEGDRDRREVGPLRAEIVEPFRSWRLVLEPGNGRPASFDLTFTATNEPMEVSAPVFHRRDGRHVTWDLWHYAQAGRATGSITVEGRTFALDPAWAAARERSWGTRPVFGQTPKFAPIPDSICSRSLWLAGDFGDHSLWFWRMEPNEGGRPNLTGNLSDETGRTRLDGAIAFGLDSGKPQLRIVEAKPALTYAGDGRSLAPSSVQLTDWDGAEHTLAIRPLRTVHSIGLGYGHPDFRHIEYKGNLAQVVRTEVNATNHAALLANPAGHVNVFGLEQLCELTLDGQRGLGVARLSI
ncbi:MAG: hypothetical protein ACKVVT_16640 [Dehalococcoidia bacterium]